MTSPLDPVVAEVLNKLPSFESSKTMTPASCRKMLRDLAAARSDIPPPQPASVEDTALPGGVPIRIYRPMDKAVPTVVYFHGGGWVAGDLETHDRACRQMTLDLNAVVISVDYRRPPEAPFPAAYEDAVAATQWAFTQVASLGGDVKRIGVAGDSAGGNLAAACAIACRDLGLALAAQCLIYPATDLAGGYRDGSLNIAYPSRGENASGYFLELDTMQWFAEHYLPERSLLTDPRASPIRASSLAGLAPAVVTSAQFDPLRDEGIAYAAALRAVGVKVHEHRGAGLVHGYVGMASAVPAAFEEVRKAREDFKALLG